mmetsp:Transcript_29866/g.22141  ORF Transcript_29866/g.22141 Transcript_29866/m.22141 type:complete len:82 (+) Transcript_29866:341-586(+)
MYNYTLSYVVVHPADFEIFKQMMDEDSTFKLLIYLSVLTMAASIVGLIIFCIVKKVKGYDMNSKIVCTNEIVRDSMAADPI